VGLPIESIWGATYQPRTGLINTPLQRGACAGACKLNRFSGFSMALAGPTTAKPLKRFDQNQQRTHPAEAGR